MWKQIWFIVQLFWGKKWHAFLTCAIEKSLIWNKTETVIYVKYQKKFSFKREVLGYNAFYAILAKWIIKLNTEIEKENKSWTLINIKNVEKSAYVNGNDWKGTKNLTHETK